MQTNQMLSMVVINVQQLESGLSAQCAFRPEGGIIGSSNNTYWHLRDGMGGIQHQHCEISVIDGAFCVQDLCGNTYVNGSHMPLGKGKFARLEHKHEITIGAYQIRVIFGQAGEEHLLANSSLDQLFENDGLDLLKDGDFKEMGSDDSESDRDLIDPIFALDGLFKGIKQEESLIEDAQPELTQSLVPEDDVQGAQHQPTPQADSEFEMTSSIRLKRILGFGKKNTKTDQTLAAEQNDIAQQPSHLNVKNSCYNVSEGLGMDDKVLDLLEEEVAKSYISHNDMENAPSTNATHLLTGPMLTGLGVDVGNSHDMAKMHMLSEELGQSLQACVQGLLDLNQQVRDGRFGMMNRNLQPIEDNPLRLGLSYEDTIRTLYDADKSLVHLSAPAAISESLKNVRDHNEAMQHATAEALNQILNAFSPQVLLRRFQHYKRNSDVQHDSYESWAWDMYCHYYQELTSNRQKGFEKLFWEIFEQSYDKKIREKQLEL